ncbi:vWA domain-containing protein [Noviherbaspirillum saxi]|uniref:VWA domain-containing protein n=1 Tax=Noviherbaspirillum saxi TaxID=2320863 RepID=A0A3A3G068_9BURK|nr:VWA domain-containing protein [Noviherbaspirillum saxi]RJF92719.1 VWA domain-containing protein [Noviherbaspirillum saxi]
MSVAAPSQDKGLLAENVVHFARVLRRAGLAIGPAKVIDALRALQAVGVERRDDFYYALSTVLVDRRDQQFIFDQAFELYWRDPSRIRLQLQQIQDLLGGVRSPKPDTPKLAPRIAQAMLPRAPRAVSVPDDLPPDLRLDASMTMSRVEVLRNKDFAAMTAEEQAEAKKMIASVRMPLPEIASRRSRPLLQGAQVDLRSTLRHMIRTMDGCVELRHRTSRMQPVKLVILCDISGSMENYTRMLLHFIHALANSRRRVHTLLFGTRLSNITYLLRDRDVDVALGQVSRQVVDWAGGTRIGACLAEFNQHWARRLLGQGTVVLLITDGLDSGDAQSVGAQMERLSLSCRRLIWLNPLLRFEGFEARPAGIRAMLPHVDLFLPVHNLTSLSRLGAALDEASFRRSQSTRRSPHSSGEHYGNV